MLINNIGIMLRLGDREIAMQAEFCREELRAGDRIFQRNRPGADLGKRKVILTDGGLASSCMMTAARMFIRQDSKEIFVAVSTASLKTIDLVAKTSCLNVRMGSYLKVAAAYKKWYELFREEVVHRSRIHEFLADGAE